MVHRNANVTRSRTVIGAITLAVLMIAALSGGFAVAAQPATPSPSPIGDLGYYTLSGVVTTDDDATPLAGAVVHYSHHSYYADRESSGTTTTNTTGAFEFAPILLHDTDSIRITVEAPGYDTYSVLVSAMDVYYSGGVFAITLHATSGAELETALERARTFSGSNDDWEPVIRDFDGVEMVLVPAGCFMMGTTEEQLAIAYQLCEDHMGVGNCQSRWFEPELPAHQVCFEEPFWIDRTEVSHAQFDAFGGTAAEEGRWIAPDRPRDWLTWFEANDLCERRGVRLPTEAEWEYAARGPDNLIFPWGNTFDGTLVNFCETNCPFEWNNAAYDDGHAIPAPVGSYPGGASWVGALDLSGNVEEWVADWFAADYYSGVQDGAVDPQGPVSSDMRVLRGGSWYDNKVFLLRTAFRSGWFPDYNYHVFGVRCARDVDNW